MAHERRRIDLSRTKVIDPFTVNEEHMKESSQDAVRKRTLQSSEQKQEHIGREKAQKLYRSFLLAIEKDAVAKSQSFPVQDKEDLEQLTSQFVDSCLDSWAAAMIGEKAVLEKLVGLHGVEAFLKTTEVYSRRVDDDCRTVLAAARRRQKGHSPRTSRVQHGEHSFQSTRYSAPKSPAVTRVIGKGFSSPLRNRKTKAGEVSSTYVALFHFEKSKDSDLRLGEGDLIRVTQDGKHTGGWWFGQNETSGEEGFFPMNFVTPSNQTPPKPEEESNLETNSTVLSTEDPLQQQRGPQQQDEKEEEEEEEEESAAKVIQQRFRANLRSVKDQEIAKEKEQEDAARRIQGQFRKKRSQTHGCLTLQHTESKETKAAIKIQTHLRRKKEVSKYEQLKRSRSDACAKIQTYYREKQQQRLGSIIYPGNQKNNNNRDSMFVRVPEESNRKPENSQRTSSKINKSAIHKLSNKLTARAISTGLTLLTKVKVEDSKTCFPLYQIRDMLQSNNPSLLLISIKSVREVLQNHLQGSQVLEGLGCSFLTERILTILATMDSEDLQFECLWTLSNLAAVGFGRDILDSNHFHVVTSLANCKLLRLREQAIWCLGNIAGADCFCRNKLLEDHSLLNEFVRNLDELLLPSGTIVNSSELSFEEGLDEDEFENGRERVSLQQVTIWAVSNLCRGDPPPDPESVKKLIPSINGLVKASLYKESLHTDCMWCLAYLTDSSDAIRTIVGNQVPMRSIVQYFSMHIQSSTKLLLGFLRFFGNMASHDDPGFIDQALSEGLLMELFRVSNRRDAVLLKEILWVVSNIACGPPEHLEKLLMNHLILKLVSESLRAEHALIRLESLWVLNNLVAECTVRQAHMLLQFQSGLVDDLISLIEGAVDPQSVRLVFDILQGLSKKVKRFLNKNRTSLGTDPKKKLPIDRWVINLCEVRKTTKDEDVKQSLQMILTLIRQLV